MERTVPRTATDEVELYLRTYYSLLRSSTEVKIRTLEEVHAGMNSLLHPGARLPQSDLSAFIYSILRLPDIMSEVRLIVLGQSTEVFSQAGFDIDGDEWQQVSARARRRRCFYNGKGTLLCFIASRSDIDDVIPILTAYQIEWNKLHSRLNLIPSSSVEHHVMDQNNGHASADFSSELDVSKEDLERLRTIWGDYFSVYLEKIKCAECEFGVRLLSGSWSEYRRATHSWWDNIYLQQEEIRHRPVYFVSSNTHSIINLLTGFAFAKRDMLENFVASGVDELLANEWESIRSGVVPSSQENFLYFALREYMSFSNGADLRKEQRRWERQLGVRRVSNERYFDLEAQLIEVAHLPEMNIDARVTAGIADAALRRLADSQAVIINVDYPLGVAAYNILTEVAENAGSVYGVYIMGKAATLNGVIGDVMIPNVVHDEHSQNTYLFGNAFSAQDVAQHLIYGTVLDNQKSVTVLGTFLQTAQYMDVFYREGYTDIEMEAGPYLSAVYEMHRPKRHPYNEIVNLYGLPFDLGIIHYASDTPLSKGKNLGAGSLSYFGIDSTYAASIAVLRRILRRELERLPWID